MRKKKNSKCGCPSAGQVVNNGTPYYPMAIANGYLTAGKQHAPQTAVDHEPREFQRIVDASGFKHVQINNGLQRRTGSGLMGPINMQDYLSTVVPIVPGQTRDNYGGFHKKGIDPQSYAQLWADGPGAQPVNPGGPGKIAADYFVNPGTC
jgi:hypothetical protein